MKSLTSISVLMLMSSTAFAVDYSVQSGWNLLGATHDIPVSLILKNDKVKNVLIYQNGQYLSSSSNQFSKIPRNTGFFVYATSKTTIQTPWSNANPSAVIQLDANLKPTDSNNWAALQITAANLLVEMKTSDFSAGLRFTQAEAVDYCKNFHIGSSYGWRLPTSTEAAGIVGVYKSGNDELFILDHNIQYLTAATIYNSSAAVTYKLSEQLESASVNSRLGAICVKSSL